MAAAVFPTFDAGRTGGALDVGDPAAMAETLKELLACGQPLERVLPAFTSNPARLLMLPRKGRLAAGSDADLVVLDGEGWSAGRDGAGPVACAGGKAPGPGNVRVAERRRGRSGRSGRTAEAILLEGGRGWRGEKTRGYIIPVGGAEEKIGDVAILRRFATLCGGRELPHRHHPHRLRR